MMAADSRLGRIGWGYFCLLVGLSLAIVLATFLRERAQLLVDISFWFFCVTFLVSLASLRIGLLLAVLLLTVSPGLHHQLNSLIGTNLNAWAYAGVDCLIGFVAAWTVRGGMADARPLIGRFPISAILALHFWVAVSTVVAVGRNLWQSASELTVRGIAYNLWITRGLSFQDDYFPVQDLFFISVAVMVLISVWTQMSRSGEQLLRGIAAVVLAGAAANAAFGAWQKVSGKGWFAGNPGDVNAFWPEIHSFAGLMVISIAIGLGVLVSRKPGAFDRTAIIAGMIVSAVGLYVSGSRSTLLIVLLLLVIASLWAAFFLLRGWWRALPVLFVAAVMAAAGLLFAAGYRGVSLATLAAALDSGNLGALNAAVSHRPEIWRSAMMMYADYPFFGLGQGAFHRLSSIAAFSNSDVLAGMGGAGAHNYFIHSWVELGAVGLVLMLLIALPFLRLGSSNFRFVGFYALVGVVVGNLYGHTLLVREMLVLSAVLAGIYLWEVQRGDAARLKPLGATGLRLATILLAGLALAAIVEAATSLTRLPFAYGQRCFEEHPLDEDGWTRGILSVPVPPTAAQARITIEPPVLGVSRRPLSVALAVVDAVGGQRSAEKLIFAQGDVQARTVDLQLGSAGGARYIKMRVSHCFVPLDLGYAMNGRHETRRLGVRVPQLAFLSKEGAAFK